MLSYGWLDASNETKRLLGLRICFRLGGAEEAEGARNSMNKPQTALRTKGRQDESLAQKVCHRDIRQVKRAAEISVDGPRQWQGLLWQQWHQMYCSWHGVASMWGHLGQNSSQSGSKYRSVPGGPVHLNQTWARSSLEAKLDERGSHPPPSWSGSTVSK